MLRTVATITERIKELTAPELREKLASVAESSRKLRKAGEEEAKAMVNDAITVGASGGASYYRWSEGLGVERKAMVDKVDNSTLVGLGALGLAITRQFDRETCSYLRSIGRGALSESTANWARKKAQEDLAKK